MSMPARPEEPTPLPARQRRSRPRRMSPAEAGSTAGAVADGRVDLDDREEVVGPS